MDRTLFLLFLYPALIEAQNQCSSTITHYSSSSTYVLAKPPHPSVVVPVQNLYKTIPGADWIWESFAESLGSFTFVKYLPMPARLKDSLEKVSLWIICDDYFSVRMNDHVIVNKDGNWYDDPKEVDLTSYVQYSTSPAMNKLEMVCTNIVGAGGLTYKLEMVLKGAARRRGEQTNSTDSL